MYKNAIKRLQKAYQAPAGSAQWMVSKGALSRGVPYDPEFNAMIAAKNKLPARGETKLVKRGK